MQAQPRSTSTPCMLLAIFLCFLLDGCGGGGGGTLSAVGDGAAPTAAPAVADTATDAAALAARSATDVLGDAVYISQVFAVSANLRSLSDAVGDAKSGLRAVAATPLCREGFLPPADLVATAPAPLPATGTGAFFNAVELAAWRSRVKAGPFVKDADFAAASPGDWDRIQANARRFVSQGETLSDTGDAARASHGSLARDAAFNHLMAPDAALLTAVRSYLLAQVAATANDFASQRCYRALDNTARDGFFAEAPWLTRLAATYDFVRAALPAADRLLIENYLRRNAWFFATQLDWGLKSVFPQRLAGDYSVRGEDAATTGNAVWYSRAVDSNQDCTIDTQDSAAQWPRYAYARADGSLGPRVSWLQMWFNNRRAANALAAGSVGVMLGDSELVTRAKRYVMEWLAYGVWSDGASGEYSRNGEYCIAKQGLIYSAASVQGGLMLARMLARKGDRSLANFSTRAGLNGTEATGSAASKSLALVASTFLRAASGELGWYQAEPERAAQAPRSQTDLARLDVRYLASATAVDDVHELGMLSSAAIVPSVPVVKAMLEHKVITQPMPAGQTRNAVATGLGAWTDAFAVMPAAYLLRP